ncbi:hypothetical protein P167DRAFT_532182 [Morchella conica CCBAS932]|uniref:Secreted protein n=1 Tax=Morchella conica CCBAS932 TaxID=1392247 RepID=A0A3N4L7L4_9PEZI|nr:hypothetical protein P167DRAFT_532182 [Morchella conica CCBAS932]
MPWPGWRWKERRQSARVVVFWWLGATQRELGASVKSDDVATLHHPQKSNPRSTTTELRLPTTVCLPTAAAAE